jgi:hypothetical protein
MPPATLAATTQIDPSNAAGDTGETVRAPTGVLEPQQVDIEMERGLHLFHAQDWLSSFEMNAWMMGVSHGDLRQILQ